MTRSRTAALAIVPLLSLAALTGCSSDSSSDSSDSSPASTCADLQNLATQVRGLTDVNLISEGTSGITDQINAIEAAWTQVESSSNDQFTPQLDALKSALDGSGRHPERSLGERPAAERDHRSGRDRRDRHLHRLHRPDDIGRTGAGRLRPVGIVGQLSPTTPTRP